MRLTRQRRVILETLSGMDTHPTAEELYKVVRRRLPSISLGSVYRNLEVLIAGDLIQKLEAGGASMRFDGRKEDHAHARCPECGGVRDLWLDEVEDLRGRLDRLLAVHPELGSYRLEFVGRCPKCATSRGKGRA